MAGRVRAEAARRAGGTAPGDDRRSRIAAAVEQLVAALPIPAEERARTDLDLGSTPRRVADAWIDDLLDGYEVDPGAVLADAMPAAGQDLVAVTGIDFHSMCPHHLLPSRGVAHVAYLPAGRVVGFGQIARLVDCFAHRLILEESLARSIAGALMDRLGARGAAVVLDAEQACLSVRGEQRPRARAHAQCFLGDLARDRSLQARFLAIIGRAPEAAAGAARSDRGPQGKVERGGRRR